jgi:L-ribulokinase
VSVDSRDAVAVGVDFGTLSGRATVVRAADGVELGSAVHEYRHGVLDSTLPSGEPLPADWALQVPADYREVLRMAVPKAVARSGVDPADIVAIGTDFTACTVLPTTADGTPLAEVAAFARRPHAYVKLWRHHAAQPQADRITALAAERGEPWLPRYGGRISAEWEFAKALQLLEEDPELYAAAAHWVEAADWIVWQLTGRYVRNACVAGYKGIYQDGSYPSEEYLAALHPDFAGFATQKLAAPIAELGARVGDLTAEAAAWTGLRPGIAVCTGNVDAHVTAPAARAIQPGRLLAVMGTSTCHVMNATTLAEVPGMCGVVRNGITPGLWGYEAGQSGVGAIFAWFVETCVPADYHAEAAAAGVSMHELLTAKAARQAVGRHGLVALDWHAGNRSVLVDHELSGLIIGQKLATRPEDTYRALLESTAFGTRTIIEAFESSGVPVTELIVAGGLLRNELLMQIYADVTRLPIGVAGAAQGPALGSAMHAAVAAGLYADIHAASEAMGSLHREAYRPDPDRAAAYDLLYAEYRELHEHFGRGGSGAMHRLRAISRAAADR